MNWKTIWRSLQNQDMRKRILAVLGMLFVFRVLTFIPIPLGDGETLKQIIENLFSTENSPQLLNFVNVLSGGALANFSIMLVGLGPYINASIIMQLLTRAIPKLETLNKEGEYGRRKINQYTRILTFPLAIIQSIGMIFLVRQSASSIAGLGDITAGADIMQWVLIVASLTAGAMILMWLGELITEQSIGNGISLVITIGIISGLPDTLKQLYGYFVDNASKWEIFGVQLPFGLSAVRFTLILLTITALLTIFIVKLNEASRRVTVNYAKRVQGSRTYGGVTTSLPIKLITAGVIPIIFAAAFLSVPSFVGQVLQSSDTARWQTLGTNLVAWFQQPSAQTFATGGWQAWIYPVAYFLLVFLFTFFYTSIAFNAKDIAENLQKQGGFIEGVRSGKQTEKYLMRTVNRLTLFGALALGVLAVLPIAGQAFFFVDIAIGGTGLLILVSVALETLRQLESRALMVTYDDYTQPDYFSETGGVTARTRMLRLIPRRNKNQQR